MHRVIDTRTATPAEHGYLEIAAGVWLEATAIDPSRQGRFLLLEPRALTGRGHRCVERMVPLSEIADAFQRVTGWTMALGAATLRTDGWIVCRGDLVRSVFLPAWVRDPGGCSWAEPIPPEALALQPV